MNSNNNHKYLENVKYSIFETDRLEDYAALSVSALLLLFILLIY